MAKDNKKLVQAITSQEENFAQWYTDICVKAELVEYSSVKGFIILRPYGQAIWELIQKDLDARFKATGHENVAMPVLIPESLLQKEGELVNGFAPEVAWVTMGGSDKLEERLAVRPTSETMFCDHWSRVLHSYRELPMKYNQWCSVVRWEKTTRPFLRSREFWWQEGHTIHETAAEAASAEPADRDDTPEQAAASQAMTEEEMVEAAIRAGEEAAANDFKLKYEQAQNELAEVRKKLAAAEETATTADAKVREAQDRVARLQADWDNYRRRTASERLAEKSRATEKLVTALLPVLDDMERAIDHARTQEMDEAFSQFVDGVEAVRAKMLDVFGHEGVEAIDPKGEAFNPLEHQAVGRVEDPEQYDETVNDVYQKGYRMADRVLRAAMVTVTYGGEKRPAPEPEASEEAPDAASDEAAE